MSEHLCSNAVASPRINMSKMIAFQFFFPVSSVRANCSFLRSFSRGFSSQSHWALCSNHSVSLTPLEHFVDTGFKWLLGDAFVHFLFNWGLGC